MERFIFSMFRCFSIFFLFASISILFPQLMPAHGQESMEGFDAQLHQWERYVQEFRRDHNFSLFVGRTEGTWMVSDFGGLKGQEYAMTGVAVKIQYGFHIPLWLGLGYFLGSSVGYYFESIRSNSFKPAHSLHLPGLLIGLVYDFSPSFRVLLGIDTYLERLDGIKEQSSSQDSILDATMLTWFDSSLSFDYFFDLNLAARFEAHKRRVSYIPMDSSEGKIESASFNKQDWWLGVGLVYHIL